MKPLTEHAQEVISRTQVILVQSLVTELRRAIACCKVAKMKRCDADSIPYLLVAEATSAKFIKLHSQRKLMESESILDFMTRLEIELGGNANALICSPEAVKSAKSRV